MTFRRSIVSEILPTGHCENAPPNTATLMKIATELIDMPLSWANTGPSVQKAPLASPAQKQPEHPMMDALNNHRSRSLTSKMGEGAIDSVKAIGRMGIDRRYFTIIKIREDV